jgi:hypothetical protein
VANSLEAGNSAECGRGKEHGKTAGAEKLTAENLRALAGSGKWCRCQVGFPQ